MIEYSEFLAAGYQDNHFICSLICAGTPLLILISSRKISLSCLPQTTQKMPNRPSLPCKPASTFSTMISFYSSTITSTYNVNSMKKTKPLPNYKSNIYTFKKVPSLASRQRDTNMKSIYIIYNIFSLSIQTNGSRSCYTKPRLNPSPTVSQQSSPPPKKH